MKYACFVSAFVLTLVLFAIFSPQSAFGYTTIHGGVNNISVDTIWVIGETYVIDGDVSVNSGARLTIQSGAIVKFKEWASLTISGELVVNGTSASRSYFTSFNDDSVGGDTNGDGPSAGSSGYWSQIRFNPGSSSNINYATIRFGGRGAEASSNLYITGGSLTVSNSVIDSAYYGFHMTDGSVTIDDNIIRNTVVGIYEHGAGNISFNDNVFIDNSDVAGQFQYSGSNTIISSGNRASGIGKKAFFVYGPMYLDYTWTNELPYIIYNVAVASGKTLTINPGAVIKFSEFSHLDVSGTLNANGTADLPIFLTSLKDDSIGGDTNNVSGMPAGNDWAQVQFNPGSVGSIKHAVIRYGGNGWNINSNVYIDGGMVNISDSTIASSAYFGLLKTGGSLSVTNSIIKDNAGYGVYNMTITPINAVNNYWGVPSGPTHITNPGGTGDRVSYYVDYEPWLTSPPVFDPEPTFKEPVIIVPGILGSRLNRVSDGEEVWPNEFVMFANIEDNFLNDLKLDSNGKEIFDIDPSEIIESVFFLNQYENLIKIFKNNDYDLDKDLFIVPYDWRLDITTSSGELDSVLTEAIGNSPTGKVNIIAHSMGGLLVKDYLIRNGDSAVNKLIFAGTPHLGAPKAFNVLNWGDDFDIRFLLFGLNKSKAKDIAQNMPAVYELLPSREYLNKAGSYVRDTDRSLDYNEINQFLTSSELLADHRNSSLVTRADEFHQSHDSWLPQTASVYNLLGCREYDTIGYFNFDRDGSVDIDSITGDGTVPFVSANQIPGENYYVLYPATRINHMGLISDNRTIGIIYDIITGSELVLPNGISKNDGFCEQVIVDVRRLRFSTHSPVNLHVYDSLGNHTGLTSEGNIEMNIPDSNFVQVGDSNFVFVPDGVGYSIHIEAYSTGSFDFKVKSLVNGEVKESVVYNDVPIDNPSLEAEFEFTDINNIGSLDVDREGDGVIDAGYISDNSWVPYNATIQSTIDDLERIYLLGWTNGEVKNSLKSLLKASMPTEATVGSKGKKSDRVLGTAFLKQLETEYNKGNIQEKAFNIIKVDILWLLNL